jgi:deoxyribodipyrimidine photolyase-like uncharacterized protein
MKNSILIFGDQLTSQNTALEAGHCGRDVVLLVEARDSGRAHKIKRVFQFTAMREFAAELRQNGWEVDYRKIIALGSVPNFDCFYNKSLIKTQKNSTECGTDPKTENTALQKKASCERIDVQLTWLSRDLEKFDTHLW